MSKLGITGVTLSIEFGDTEYGAGTKSFMNLQARIPDGEPVPVDNASQIIDEGLMMYFTAWKTLMAGRASCGVIKRTDFEEFHGKVVKRVALVQEFLKNNP